MEKINIAKLLKDCPKGMELDCTMYENVTFVRVDMSRKQFPIEIAVSGIRSKYLTKEGCFHDTTLSPESKCVIFPKGKTTWEGFHKPFKDGDVITCNNTACTFVSIFKEKPTEKSFKKHCSVILDDNKFIVGIKYADYANPRFATEEEKEKLFDAIKENGYKWNSETKTLEKLPKFKVGDRIRQKTDIWPSNRTIKSYDKNIGYFTTINDWVRFEDQDNWELVPNKFDINTLVPFESKVLVRDDKLQKWSPAIWGFYDSDSQDYQYKLIGVIARYCIPYEGNEHLLGTTDDCDEYFKTWK